MKKNIFAKSETEYPYSIVLQPCCIFSILCRFLFLLQISDYHHLKSLIPLILKMFVLIVSLSLKYCSQLRR